MKPTDEQIRDEIGEWVIALDGSGIVITDEELLKQTLDQSNFESVRELFPINKELLEALKNALARMDENPPQKAKKHDHDSIFRVATFYRDREAARAAIQKAMEG